MFNPFKNFNYKGVKKVESFYTAGGSPKSTYITWLKSVERHIEVIIDLMGSLKVVDLESAGLMRVYINNYEYLIRSKVHLELHIEERGLNEENGWSSKND